MSELPLQGIAVLKLLTAAVFAGLYGLGGMYNKALRRYLAPVLLAGAMILFAGFHWAILLYIGLFMASLSIGYGGDYLLVKMRKRFFYGLALGCSAFALTIVNPAWLLLGFHIVLCVFTSVILGVWNPMPGGARDEETIIGFMAVLIPLFIIGVR